MVNPKISGIAAGAGFILSFLLGIITGAAFLQMLIRALVFAVIFFVLSGVGYWVINTYLPELIDAVSDSVLDKGEVPTLGAQVDISVGDDTGSMDAAGINSDISLNDFMENPGESEENTLDQNDEYSYTKMGDLEETPFNPVNTDPLEMDFPAGEGDSVDGLPDLDLMSGAFGSGEPAVTDSPGAGASMGNLASTGGLGPVSPGGGLASAGSLFDIEAKDARSSLGKKGLESEFTGKNVQEMASAIQTILKREDKG